ncbi:TPA: YaaL family protein [Clostridium perfringens]
MDKKKISDYLIKKIDYSNEDQEILKAIEQTILEMEVARSAFQNAYDDKLIDSLIYKEQDINARYEYLIREAKKRGIKVSLEHIFKNAKISII